jgi:hypothetical protein
VSSDSQILGANSANPVLCEEKEPRLGWNWIWYFPLCIAVLVIVEGHTVRHAMRLCQLARSRWLWFVLFSPSAYFCISVVFASVGWPIQLLAMIAKTAKTPLDRGEAKQTVLFIVFLSVVIFLMPFVTDFLTWGSFPLSGGGLRLIPFLPWPQGNMTEY